MKNKNVIWIITLLFLIPFVSAETVDVYIDSNIMVFIILFLLFALFFILSGTFTPFFLIGDGLVLGLGSFFLRTLLINTISSLYANIIFIFSLLLAVLFIVGGIWLGIKGRS